MNSAEFEQVSQRQGKVAAEIFKLRERVDLYLMANDTEAITQVVITKAKKGDLTACKIVLDRIAPVRTGSTVNFPLADLVDARAVLDAHGAIMRACSRGHHC